jgi:hypothetical protein
MKTQTKNCLKISSGLSLLLAVVLSACSSGTKTASNSATTSNPPQGPNSYPAIQALFNPTPTSNIIQSSAHRLQSSTTGNCGVTDGEAAAGLATATGFISFIPIAGPALGAISGGVSSVLALEGANAGNACIQAELNLIIQQLAVQEAQIQNITNALNLSNNTFYMDNYLNALSNETTDQYLFQQSVSYFTGISNNGVSTNAIGLMGNVMYDIQFWNSSTSSGASTAIYMSESNLAAYMAANPAWLTNTYLPAVTKDGNQQDYQNNLVSLSGAITSDTCSQPYQCVTQAISTTSSQLLMYQQLYNLLVSQIQTQNYNNYVSLYDQYNDTLMQAYQQSVFAIQQAYYLEYLNNQVNYNNAMAYVNSTSILNQSLSYGNVPATIFYVDNASTLKGESVGAIQQQYVNAQEQLTLLFAAYINQAFQNTLEYIVTDKVMGAQTYPSGSTTFIVNGQSVTDNNPPNYAALLSSGKTDNGSTVQTPMSFLLANLNAESPGIQGYTSALGASLQKLSSTTMIYQYYGLNDIRTWAQSVSTYNATNTESSAELLSIIASNYESAPQLFINGSNSFVQFNQAVVPGYLATSTGYPNGLNYQTTNQSLMPYYVAPNSYPQVSGSLANNINLSACNPSAVGAIPGYNLYWYIPNGADGTFSLGTQGVPYLMCGNWQTNFYQSDVSGSINNNMVSYTGSNSSFGYLAAHMLVFANLAGNAWTKILFTNNPSGSRPITFMYAYDPNNFGVGYYDGSTLVPGTSYNNNFWAGGFGNANEKNDYVSVTAGVQTTFPDGFIASFGINPVQNSNDYDTNTIGISYNPNLDIVQINGESINSEYSRWNSPGNSDGMPYNWAPAFLLVTLTSINPSGNNSYVSGLLLNGNLLFVNGAPPENGATFNGYNYPGQNTYLSLNPAGYTPNMPAPYSITVPNCEWPWVNYKSSYELPTFICTLSNYW